MYSGKIRDDLPLGPGTILLPEENSNLWKGSFLAPKSNGSSKWSFQSIEWLQWIEKRMQATHPGLIIKTFFKGGEERLLDDSFGQIYLDGYAVYQGRKYAFEYNGCAWHYCIHCGRNPEKRLEEEKRQRKEIIFLNINFDLYIQSLSRIIREKVDVLEIKSSCQWNQEKVSYGDITPELFRYNNRRLTIEEIEDEILQNRLFGICKIDIMIPPERRSKWQARNFPPIITKKCLSEDQISDEMRNLLRQKKTKFPLGETDAVKIIALEIKSRSAADEFIQQ